MSKIHDKKTGMTIAEQLRYRVQIKGIGRKKLIKLNNEIKALASHYKETGGELWKSGSVKSKTGRTGQTDYPVW
jgi:hypothetical protein